MKPLSELPRKPFVTMVVHTGSGEPLALRVSVRHFHRFATAAMAIFLATTAGSLLFFAEADRNRKLTGRLLQLELDAKMRSPSRPAAPVAPESAVGAETPGVAAGATIPRAPARSEPDEAAGDVPTGTPSQVRIGELGTECSEGVCRVRMGLSNTRTGVVSGMLLMVLETAVPRIGSSGPESSVRRKYFVYPGGKSFDEWSAANVTEHAPRVFRFNRSLQTTADFAVGKLLRPLALNVYLLDDEKNLVRHERRSMETLDE
jgi:hypothetical protein